MKCVLKIFVTQFYFLFQFIGDFADAVKDLETAVRLNPGNEEYRTGLDDAKDQLTAKNTVLMAVVAVRQHTALLSLARSPPGITVGGWFFGSIKLTLKPVGHQSTNSMLFLALIFAMAAFTSLGTTSPLYSKHTAIYELFWSIQYNATNQSGVDLAFGQSLIFKQEITLTNDSWLQVDENSPGDMFPRPCLIKKGGIRVNVLAHCFIIGHHAIRLDPMFHAVEFPTGIAHLNTCLANAAVAAKGQAPNPATRPNSTGVHESGMEVVDHYAGRGARRRQASEAVARWRDDGLECLWAHVGDALDTVRTVVNDSDFPGGSNPSASGNGHVIPADVVFVLYAGALGLGYFIF
ncbi:unnamed protein product, partial [Notodromas monacha]